MAKLSQRKKLIRKLDQLLAQYIRKRDENTCQRCGKHSTDNRAVHVNHIIPRNKGYRYRWEPFNAMILCFKCHIGWWHKNPLEASIWFREEFKSRFKYLISLPSAPVKYSDDDLKRIAETLKELIARV